MITAPSRRWFRFGFASAIQLMAVLLPTVAVTSALVWTNCMPTFVIGFSHGFYDHDLTVTGWPIIYCRRQIDTPQSGAPVFQNRPVVSEASMDWLSPFAMLSDVVLSGCLIGSTAAVCMRILRMIRKRQVSLADLLWFMLAASVAIAIAMHSKYPSFSAELLGANTDGPRLATFIWYPVWVQVSFGVGMVCVALFTCWAVTHLAGLVQNAKSARLQP